MLISIIGCAISAEDKIQRRQRIDARPVERLQGFRRHQPRGAQPDLEAAVFAYWHTPRDTEAGRRGRSQVTRCAWCEAGGNNGQSISRSKVVCANAQRPTTVTLRIAKVRLVAVQSP